jgi:hypothetical protein
MNCHQNVIQFIEIQGGGGGVEFELMKIFERL